MKERLRGGLFPAVPVPRREDGSLDGAAQDAYARWMAAQPVAGAAVWVHTGRGLLLPPAMRREVLRSWREALGPERLLIDEPLGRFVHAQALHDLRNLFSRLSGTTGIGRAYGVRLTDEYGLVAIAEPARGGGLKPVVGLRG